MPERNLTEEIARFTCGTTPAMVPEACLRMAQNAFVDVIGVMLAAREEPVVGVLRNWFDANPELGGQATLLLDATSRTSPSRAALLNATAAHALDYDDVAFGAHPSAALVPAILAQGERSRASGLQALCAYVVGYEVWAEIAGREQDAYHDKGWHPTSAVAPIAVAAAVAHLQKASPAVTRSALSLASSCTGGVVANFGSMTKPFHVGRAASAAIAAVELAGLGMTASEDAIGGAGGVLGALSPRGHVNLDGRSQLGEHWYALSNPVTFKKYPVCFAAHRVIDALLSLVQREDVRPEDVAAIEVAMRPTQGRLLRHHRPQTALQAKFSIQFAAAAILLKRRLGLRELTDEMVTSEPVQNMMRMVSLRLNDAEQGADAGPGADRIVLRTRDGRVLDSGDISGVVIHTDAQAKFLDCCEAASVAGKASLLDRLCRLQTLDDVGLLAE